MPDCRLHNLYSISETHDATGSGAHLRYWYKSTRLLVQTYSNRTTPLAQVLTCATGTKVLACWYKSTRVLVPTSLLTGTKGQILTPEEHQT